VPYKIFSLSLLNGCFLVSLLCQCTTSPRESLADRLFPDGQYQQSIRLEIKRGQQDELVIPMTSLSKVQNKKFMILGLTPFGGRAFTASGKLGDANSMKSEFFVPLPKALSPNFVNQTLLQIQNLHDLRRSQLTSKVGFDEFRDRKLTLRVYRYNDDGIPGSFTLQSPRWKAYVQTTDYRKRPPPQAPDQE
jgi:hypothetical protein